MKRYQLVLTAGALLLAGCASKPAGPVLYPNAHLKQVGQPVAERDIAECRQMAANYGVSKTKDGKIATNAAAGAAIGGASAGAWGLVRGDAGQRALAGAAAGAAAGTVRGAVKSTETSPVYKKFVQKCLRDKGYEVIGWQ